MKKYLVAFLILLLVNTLQAQLGSTISVSGRYVLGPCGDTLLLRGVNYAPYNWGWSPTQLRINEIASSGANCVRLVWYKNPATGTPTTTYTNLTNLDSVLSKCIQYKLIPIVDLHDLTCANNPTDLINLSSWYTSTAVKNLINKYKHSLILNIANECLYVNWTGNPTVAQNTFVSTYTTVISNLRSNGINVPLMIDAPDCGTNLDVLTAIGNTLQTNDIKHNLIFSAHAYWYSYANNDSSIMLSKINNALAVNLPFVFGEIANSQDDATMCQYALNYKALLNICKSKKVGWLAWGWDNDGCPSRQISSTGLFANLTTYGQDIIYNASFGLQSNPSSKSMYLLHNACKVSVKAFHEGFYKTSTHFMEPVFLNAGYTLPASLSDSITLEIHDNSTAYNLLHVGKYAWRTDGWLEAKVPLGVIGSTVLFALKHRNGLLTWSQNAQILKSTLPYDFTTMASQAMGNNLRLLEPAVYGLYAGDLNQDETIDVFDYLLVEPDIINGSFGYLIADLNGDGSVDAFDFMVMENSITQGRTSFHP